MSTTRSGADCSAHRLAMFDQCPRELRFYLTNARGQKRTSPAMTAGKVFHAAIERMAWARRTKPGTLPAVPTEEEVGRVVDVEAVVAGLAPDAHREVREAAIVNRAAIDLSNALTNPEHLLVVDLAPDVKAECRLDFVRRVDLRDGGWVVVVTDWKCGASPPITPDEAWHEPQVGLYLVAARATWPDATGWEFHRVHVRHQRIVRVAWSRELDEFWRGRAAAATRAWRDDGVAVAKIGRHCAECPFRAECGAWVAALEEAPDVTDPLAEVSDRELLETREALAATEAIASARRKDHDREIALRVAGCHRIRGGGLAGALVSKDVPKVAVEAVLELAHLRHEDPASLLSQVVSVSAKKLKQVARTDQEKAVVAKWTTKKSTRSVRVTKARTR